jgi:hypothetical protein
MVSLNWLAGGRVDGGWLAVRSHEGARFEAHCLFAARQSQHDKTQLERFPDYSRANIRNVVKKQCGLRCLLGKDQFVLRRQSQSIDVTAVRDGDFADRDEKVAAVDAIVAQFKGARGGRKTGIRIG